MKQAIVTKFLAPTNFRGSRIVAKCQAGKITIAYDHALNADANHHDAAEALRQCLDWDKHGTLIGGALPDGNGYCWVFSEATK